MNAQCNGGSRSSAKETSALKMRSSASSHQKLTKTNRERHRSWSSYNDTRGCWRTQRWPFYSHLAFEASWKDEKAWQVGSLRRWSQIKKIVILKCLLLFYTTANHFLIGLWHVAKSRFYVTTGDNLSGWTDKKLQSPSQSQTSTKKVSWSLSGGLLPIWSITVFWILAKPLFWYWRSMRNMLSIWAVCSANWWDACSWHWSTKRALFFSMTPPDHTSHNQCFKSWTNSPRKFCLICHIHLTSL